MASIKYLIKSVTTLLVITLLTVTTYSAALSQTCYRTTRIDVYSCVWVPNAFTGGSCKHQRIESGLTTLAMCNPNLASNPMCNTYTGICSSNDSCNATTQAECNYQACTSSPGQCWGDSSNPTDPGDPGGGDPGVPWDPGSVGAGLCNASCYQDSDCTEGRTCFGNGPLGSGIAGVCRNPVCSGDTDCVCNAPSDPPVISRVNRNCIQNFIEATYSNANYTRLEQATGSNPPWNMVHHHQIIQNYIRYKRSGDRTLVYRNPIESLVNLLHDRPNFLVDNLAYRFTVAKSLSGNPGDPIDTRVMDTPVSVDVPACCPVASVTGSSTCSDISGTPAGAGTWTWPHIPGVTHYSVNLYVVGHDTALPAPQYSTGGYALAINFGCGAPGSTCTYTRELGPGDFQIRIAGRSGNTPESCARSATDMVGQIQVDYCSSSISGNVYTGNRNDFNPQADDNSFCSVIAGGGAVPTQPGALSQVVGWGPNPSVSSPIQGDGSFSLTMLQSPQKQNIQLQNFDPSLYQCLCPNSACQYSHTVIEDQTEVNFFLSGIRTAWMQVVGGDAHVNNSNPSDVYALESFNNPIPFTCWYGSQNGGDCSPFTFVRSNPLVEFTAGILTKRTEGSVTKNEDDADYIALTQDDFVDGPNTTPRQVESILTRKENYAYFYRQMEMGIAANSDAINPDNFAKPSTAPGQDRPGYFYADDIIDTVIIDNDTWQINPGESLVVFIDGDLDIRRGITVANGGFLAFIVSGDLSIGPNVSQLQGLIVADGEVNIESLGDPNNDIQLNFEGTLVGWNGIYVNRSYRNLTNNDEPVFVAKYRPDLFANAPADMKRGKFRWSQLAP